MGDSIVKEELGEKGEPGIIEKWRDSFIQLCSRSVQVPIPTDGPRGAKLSSEQEEIEGV